MATLEVDLVSPSERLWRGEASGVYARSVEGELGVLANHLPILLALQTAPLEIHPSDGDPVVFAVHGGFLEYRDGLCTVLADRAEAVDAIDVARAEAARDRAEAGLDDDAYEGDARADLARAELRLRLAGDS